MPPINDNFASRTTMSGDSGTLAAQTIVAATTEGSEPLFFGQTNTVWYDWTPSVSGAARLHLTLSAGWEVIIDVFTGSSLGSLSEVQNGGFAFDDVVMTFNVVAGTSYKIQVGTGNGATGTFSISWDIPSPPANDDFANAIVLTGSSGSVGPIDAFAATFEVGEPGGSEFFGSDPSQSTWYKWVAPANGDVTFNFSASLCTSTAFDEWVNTIWSGTSLGSLVEEACQDMFGAGPHVLTFTAVSGTTYYIQVATWGGEPWAHVSFSWVMALTGTIAATS